MTGSLQYYTRIRGLKGPNIAYLCILLQSVKVLRWMVHGVNLQIFMQSPGLLETRLVILSNILWVNRQPKEESTLFVKQTYWADILCNLNAIHETICAFGADQTRLASTTLVEILSISCFVLPF